MPSYFNGVYGHKASANLLSEDFQHPPAVGLQLPLLTTGPICRYASDLRLLMKIFLGSKYQDLLPNYDKPVDLKKLKYYFIKDLQGNMLVTEPSEDTRDALKKAISFVETCFGVEVNEIKLNKFKSSFQIWSTNMNNGKANSDSFSRLLTDGNGAINPYMELLKSILGLQKTHTLPALALAITERIPTSNPQHHIELGNKLRQEIQEIIGWFFKF